MKTLWQKLQGYQQWWGVAFILLLNLFILTSVAYERWAEPVAQLSLNQRELNLPRYIQKESDWYALDLDYRDDIDRYDRDLILSLGFTEEQLDEAGSRSRIEHIRDVFVVLEFNGPAYSTNYEKDLIRAKKDISEAREDLRKNPIEWNKEQLQEALEEFDYIKNHNTTRLFLIDAHTDLSNLMARYSESGKYLFLKARARLLSRKVKRAGKNQTQSFVNLKPYGMSINVPSLYHHLLGELLFQKKAMNQSKNESYIGSGKKEPGFSVHLLTGPLLYPRIKTMEVER